MQVAHPVAVDPDAKLREQALKRGWEIISLRLNRAFTPLGKHLS